MARKKISKQINCINVIFVEGDADEILFNRLIQYYRLMGFDTNGIVQNTHGFPDEKNMRKGLKKLELESKNPVVFNAVVCEYDTDVFVKKIQLEPNWKKVEENLKRNYSVSHFCRIEAKTSIEDWMLDDIESLLKALNLPSDTTTKGRDGQEKVKNLFKKKNIVYDRHKGKEKIKPILDKLDISKIRDARKKELKEFERLLGVKNLDDRN